MSGNTKSTKNTPFQYGAPVKPIDCKESNFKKGESIENRFFVNAHHDRVLKKATSKEENSHTSKKATLLKGSSSQKTLPFSNRPWVNGPGVNGPAQKNILRCATIKDTTNVSKHHEVPIRFVNSSLQPSNFSISTADRVTGELFNSNNLKTSVKIETGGSSTSHPKGVSNSSSVKKITEKNSNQVSNGQTTIKSEPKVIESVVELQICEIALESEYDSKVTLPKEYDKEAIEVIILGYFDKFSNHKMLAEEAMNFTGFCNAIEEITAQVGIKSIDRKLVKMLYDSYDKDGNGYIDLKEFGLLFNRLFKPAINS